MQPHSMCCLAVARCIWNHPEPIKVNGNINIEVEYQTAKGEYKYNHYRVSDVRESSDRRELTMHIIRSSGGISCTMTARRSSVSEGSEVTLYHSQQHLSGLRETFRLMRKRIADGSHNRTSEKYEGFEGESNYHDRLTLYCELKKKGGGVVRVPYNLKIDKFDYTVMSDKHSNNFNQDSNQSQEQKKKSLMGRLFG